MPINSPSPQTQGVTSQACLCCFIPQPRMSAENESSARSSFSTIARSYGTCTVDYGASYLNHDGVPNLSKSRQDPILIALGGAIRQIRLEKGISQEKLALLAEVDRSYVGRVERGDNNVAMLTLARLAKALEISLRNLMDRSGL